MKRLVCESLEELFESPDAVSLPNLTYNMWGEVIDNDEDETLYFEDQEAVPFWLEDGELVMGKAGGTHTEGAFPRIGKGHYPGRIWLNAKIMTFWEYPDQETFFKIVDGIGERIQEDMYQDWQVEIVGDKSSELTVWRKQASSFKSRLIPISEFVGSQQRSQEELGKEHVKSPLLKKPHRVPDGFGSKNPKYQSNRAWQMASLTNESNK